MSGNFDSVAIPGGCAIRRTDMNLVRESGTYKSATVSYFVEVSNDVDEIACAAVAMEHPLIPKEGSRIIPGLPLFVQSINSGLYERLDNKNYLIKVDVNCVGYGDYNGPGIFTYFIRTNNQTVDRSVDRFGQRISVKYKPKDKDGNTKKDKDGNDIEITQYPQVPRNEVEVEILAKGVIYSNNPGSDVGNRWLMYRNSNEFMGMGAYKLLCSSMELDPIDLTSNPQKWRLQLRFTSRPEGWTPVVAWTDSDTGEVPSDITSQPSAIAYPSLYGAIDYGTTWPLNGVLENPGPAPIPEFYNLNIGIWPPYDPGVGFPQSG